MRMRGLRLIIGLTIAGLLVPPLVWSSTDGRAAFSTSLDQSVAVRSLQLVREGEALTLRYCGTDDIGRKNADLSDALVIIHGDGRNACSYARSATEAARLAGRDHSTLVIAPLFAAAEDPEAGLPGVLYWSSGGWKQGDDSLRTPSARPWSISSFEVVDEILDRVADRRSYPMVERIILAGHSAGGQFVNRYSALSPARSGVGSRQVTVVASPSTYLYLGPERADRSTHQFRALTSGELRSCSSVNRYKYGLDRRSGRAAFLTNAQVLQRVRAARVRYLVGSEDHDPAHSSLDTGCAATWQGTHRLDRAHTYARHLTASGVPTRVVEVAGVGHTARGMITSPEGVAALFR